MAKHKVTQSSLNNLKKGNLFSENGSEFAREAQKKSVAKRNENTAKIKAYKEVAEETLNSLAPNGQTFQELVHSIMKERMTDKNVKLYDILNALDHLAIYSGQKPKETLEHTITEPIKFEIIRKKWKFS